MSYTRQLPGAPLSSTQWRATGLDYSRRQLPELDKNNLNEQVGVGGVSGDATVYGPGIAAVKSTTSAIDWNKNFSTSNTALSIPLLNQIINASGMVVCEGDGIGPDGTAVADGTRLPGYNDWANLRYDVRASLDVADGNRFSLETKEKEIGFQAPPDNRCVNPDDCLVVVTVTDQGPVDSDGDGVIDLEDNCPNVANPLQDNVCAESTVAIDVRTGRNINTVRLDSPHPLWVAILGSSTFDATEVRPDTIRLAQAAVVRHGSHHLCRRVDVNKDGFRDLDCMVNKHELVLPSGDDAVAVLTGKTRSGIDIRGEDSIHILRGRSHHPDD
jgi:Thrombospondin type 3 repeat